MSSTWGAWGTAGAADLDYRRMAELRRRHIGKAQPIGKGHGRGVTKPPLRRARRR